MSALPMLCIHAVCCRFSKDHSG